ncbi:MAG: hypothetical protein VKP62_09745 [Candidatus Sericytochromatia bacterium]|nr:hypothetical protein [Candidatus Sericytochromatia bacterium]
MAVVVQDHHMLRAEAESFQAGRYEEAAERASRVWLLKPWMRAQLRGQIPVAAARGRRIPMELPLVEALARLEPDPVLKDRLRGLQVDFGAPEQLLLRDLKLEPGPPCESPLEAQQGLPAVLTSTHRWLYQPLAPAARWEQDRAYQLTRVGPHGTVTSAGTGWWGCLGGSWGVSPDGLRAAVARTDEHLLERWELLRNRAEWLPLPVAPVYVAVAPAPRDDIAFTTGERGDEGGSRVLHLWSQGRTRRLFPPPGESLARLGIDWDPTGRSLLVRGLGRWPPRPGDRQQLVWLSSEGRELMRTIAPFGPSVPPPRWVRGPSAWVGLALPQAAWLWDGRARSAQALAGIAGSWGISPSGSLLAGIEVGHLFVASRVAPARRRDFPVAGLPPFFVLDAAGFSWDADGLTMTGRTAAREQGAWRRLRIRARLMRADGDAG